MAQSLMLACFCLRGSHAIRSLQFSFSVIVVSGLRAGFGDSTQAPLCMFCTVEASCIVPHNVKSICVLLLDPTTGRRSDLFFESCQTLDEACIF